MLALDLVEQFRGKHVIALIEALLGQAVERVDVASDIFGVTDLALVTGTSARREDDCGGDERQSDTGQVRHG